MQVSICASDLDCAGATYNTCPRFMNPAIEVTDCGLRAAEDPRRRKPVHLNAIIGELSPA